MPLSCVFAFLPVRSLRYKWQYSLSVQQGYEGVKIKPSGAKEIKTCASAASGRMESKAVRGDSRGVKVKAV